MVFPQGGIPLRGKTESIMYKVYILKSFKNNKHYIGHSENLEKRLSEHNRGDVRSTKNGKPWSIIYIENYESKSEARKRELEIKSYKGGIKFKKLLGIWKDK